MGLGRYETKLVASAKLGTMEKYGYCYADDLEVVKEFLSDEVCCEELENGKIKITRNNRSFEVQVKGKTHGKGKYEKKWAIDPSPERKGKWVSIFDPENH